MSGSCGAGSCHGGKEGGGGVPSKAFRTAAVAMRWWEASGGILSGWTNGETQTPRYEDWENLYRRGLAKGRCEGWWVSASG